MRKTTSKPGESGIALLLAIFTLLLLAALGLALLSAADLETTIAANYRDKQVSIYAAMSGLQEARDRLIPSRCQTADGLGVCVENPVAINTLDMGLPTAGAATPYVAYIVNPYNDEPVIPWKRSNTYFDAELCQEKAMTGICSSGSVPTGNWFRSNSYLDDSNANAGEYNISPLKPLSFKWVRIMAKTDNMTPAYAMGAGPGGTGYGSVMCWDGSHQVPSSTSPGYDNTCTASTHSIMLVSGSVSCSSSYPTCTFNPPLGSGYSNPTTITIDAPASGTRATATAHIVQSGSDQVSSVAVTNGGANYTSAPTVTIAAPPSGTQATAIATVVPAGVSIASLSAVTQTNPIGCYATTPTVSFSGGSGSGAVATANMSGTTCVAGWTIALTNSCTGGTYSVSAVGGGGSAFQGTVTIKNNGKAISGTPAITNAGSGYTSYPTGITGAGSCKFSTQWVLGTQVQSLSLTNGGSGYKSTDTVTVAITAPTSPAGTQRPAVTASLGSAPANAGKVTAITVTNGGSGYTPPPAAGPAVTFTGGGGTGAIANAVVGSTGKIDSITITGAGGGYTSAPNVYINGVLSSSVKAQLVPVTQLGRVFILTALAVAPGGSKTMTQMEVATPISTPFPTSMPAALTLDAPSVKINPASSNNYVISGKDASNAVGTKPAVGVFDDPGNPTNPTSTSCITSILGGAQVSGCSAAGGVKSNNYIGSANSPDVENTWGQLGSLTTVAGVDSLANAIASRADYTDVSPATLVGSHLMSYNTSNPAASTCPTVVVNGDLTLTGGGTYCGVLLVTGNLTLQGNYTWYGPVFVIGTGGTFTGGGGGNGEIVGSLFVAKTKVVNADGSVTLLSQLGTPDVSFQILGGGGNGIQYDSNWSDRLLQLLGQGHSYSPSPLKVLSIRNIY